MPSYYWIKLYHEILDDPKMALLPDRLWRRIIELFIIAGKYGTTGMIPDTRSIAWLLRMDANELDLDMKQIAATGIIEQVTNGWLVVNFEKRQEKVSGARRTAEFRKRQKKEQYYNESNTDNNGDVTTEKLNVTQNQINRTDTDTDKEEVVGRISTLFSNNFVPITPMIKDQLIEICNEFEEAWITDAMKIAVQNNARRLNYVTAILDRWKLEGKDSDKPKKNGYNRKPDTRQAEIDATLKEVFG